VRDVLVFAAGCAAGVVNSMAGGGTLLTFPTLVWLGLSSVRANVTSTLALWPGSLGSVWGYRKRLAGGDSRVFALVVPSIAGGTLGAGLMVLTPTEVFDRLVPFLILFATALFMSQEQLQRRFDLASLHQARSHWLSWTMFFQFLVGVYGGYFGAGIGILMLAALSLMGHTDIHRMNAVKSLLALCVNLSAAIYFALTADVVWRDALLMAAGAILGGVVGARLAFRIGRRAVRRVVVIVGLVSALSLMLLR
jgi:uncharacterized membrane protein YfcA